DDLFKYDYSINLARSDLKILNKIVSSSSKATLPTLNINSTYKYGNKYGSDRGGKDNKDLVTTFELVTPVYDGNDIKNMIRKAEKSKEIGELTLKNLANNKKSELEKATNDYKDATLRIELAEKMVEQSHENMRIVLTRYQAGAASIVELIDAQRLLTDSLQLAVNAYYDERAKLSEIFLLTHMFEDLKTMDQNSSYLNIDLLKNTLIIPGDNQ
ncbi:MAG: TolC family protein, partial [Candidatus Riflebacteria bacterium]|nr:TolC family protein [Candidatus Riflebacteria bacterium]